MRRIFENGKVVHIVYSVAEQREMKAKLRKKQKTIKENRKKGLGFVKIYRLSPEGVWEVFEPKVKYGRAKKLRDWYVSWGIPIEQLKISGAKTMNVHKIKKDENPIL